MILRTPPDIKGKGTFASAEGASEENLVHFTCGCEAGFREKQHEPGSLLKTFQNHALTNTRFCATLPNTKGKGRIRERRRRERRNFGTFYVWYTRRCPQNSARLVLAKNARTRGVFRKRCRITRLRIRDFARAPNKKEEEYSRAPKARAEKIWYILRVFYASMPVCEAGFGKKQHEPGSLLKTLQNHALTNTRFCARLPTQRKKSIRERRKVCTFYVCFT